MDVAFRDSSLKGPLWDEVSRKLAALGYHRSAKKCKEKFENVYKYHKRTKDGRISKQDGKTYRFFEQLEALEGQTSTPITPSIQAPTRLTNSTNNNIASLPQTCNVPSLTNFANVSQNNGSPIVTTTSNAISHSNIHSGTVSNSTSSSTSSEPERRRGKRKRKWKDFFERIMKEVIEKQEKLQMRFLETLERRERDRMVREEAWRVQEMAKMNREHDVLVHERSVSAAKDAAVIAFLQKMTEQGPISPDFQPQMSIQVKLQENPLQQPLPAPPPVSLQPPTQTQAAPTPPLLVSLQPQIQTPVPVPVPVPASAPAPAPVPAPALPIKNIDNIGDNSIPPSPSRWPKAEIQALITLRTTLDMKYQENGPKGPLWEEISMGMRRLGYNRNAKRCKEKWENINKYYKKMKESNKKRPQDAKTCPYFHQLEAIYKEKEKGSLSLGPNSENLAAPIMAMPEQQWPAVTDPVAATADQGGQSVDQNNDDEESGEDIEDEEDERDAYEIVQSKPSTMENVE
ncbi:hypothetical protein LguiA_018344 [Lonicera macranthoides]